MPSLTSVRRPASNYVKDDQATKEHGGQTCAYAGFQKTICIRAF